MTAFAFVAVGSNVGDRAAHHAAALAGMAALPRTTVRSSTDPEETEPIGPPGQDRYLNAMAALETDLAPPVLLGSLLALEEASGRVRRERWGPRTLDLDIVVYDDVRLHTPALTIPHPELANRPFWIADLASLFPLTWEAVEQGFPPWAHVTRARRGHLDRVAGLVAAWGWALGVSTAERTRWIRAAYLHDALKDGPADLLRELAGEAWEAPGLDHGPAASRLARRKGETDQGVLDAVYYHTVGSVDWDQVGRMLYLADYLEPGRALDPEDRAALCALVPQDPRAALREVARRRRAHVLDAGYTVPGETIAFWEMLDIADE